MGGEWVVKKPSRSDEVVEAEQQLKIADEIRAHFDSLAPKRPPKPNRSEATTTHDDSTTQHHMVLPDHSIPELAKLRQLSSQYQSICPEEGFSGTQVEEEFIETQYYTKLNSIDKQHHTTGTGFIRASEESEIQGSSDFQLQRRREGAEAKTGLGSNPATNDWI